MSSRLDLGRLSSDASSQASEVSPSSVEVASTPTPVRPVVTTEIVDEAVERVLNRAEIGEETKEMYRRLLASDTTAGFAASYYLSTSEARGFGTYQKLERKVINIRPVLSQEETSALVAYAPDYELRFRDAINHDHPAAAAARVVDTAVCSDLLPGGMMVKDIGGSPMHHIMSGNLKRHVCDPFEDVKDPSRHTMRALKAKRIMSDPSYSQDTRTLAAMFSRRDGQFVCGKRAQDCGFQAKATMSIHVYDVPLEQWPVIMEKAGAVLHVGCVNFPTAAYNERKGELQTVKARFEVDVSRNKLTMGFVDSPSWWYSHTWTDFMRYGVDQLIRTEGGTYSYKVMQRRGDTIFFEILRVSGTPFRSKQVYRLPGVKMVKVHGFKFTGVKGTRDLATLRRQPLGRQEYWFPASLWDDMLNQAKLDFERGVMTYDKLYNYYRTISPRNTINGVLVSGGTRVEADLVMPLVTHVGMAAAIKVLIGQHETRAQVRNIMAKRARGEAGLLRKAFDAFAASLKRVASLPLYPLAMLADYLIGSNDEHLADALLEWDYQPEIQEVPFSSVVGGGWLKKRSRWALASDEVEQELAPAYHETSADDLERALDAAPILRGMLEEYYGLKDDWEEEAGEEEPVTPRAPSSASKFKTQATSSAGGSSTAVHGEERVKMSDRTAAEKAVERRNAIQERLEESMLEEKKIEEYCAQVFRTCTDGAGRPQLEIMAARAEEYGDPDMWWIEKGVLASSASGLAFSECRYAALYTLLEDSTGSRFRSLYDVESNGREYRRVLDVSFTGWALSLERLTIFNGPDIRRTLELALDLPHDYDVVVYQGPPGCGKTYEIIRQAKAGDVVLCPARESAHDTRKKVLAKQPDFPDPTRTVSTVHSYLVNRPSDARRGAMKADTVQFDECYMTHSGEWYACAALLSATEVVAHGDDKQIPHVPRVQAAKFYLRIRPDWCVYQWVTYRCPWDVVAAFAEQYEYKVRSASKVQRSMSVSTSVDGLQVPGAELVLLVMYRDGIKSVKRLYPWLLQKPNVKLMTVHEAEGKTFKNVWLFRFDTRQRPDTLSLYDKSAYALVAISRHTDSFAYVRPVDLGDLVDRWIANAKDPRAVAAAGQMSTAGQPVQFA